MSASSDLPDDATADCSFPKDIILDILSRLPVRSLLRFRSVCKSFAALTLNPNFVAKHHNLATTTNEQLVVHTKKSFNHSVSMIVRTNKKRNDRIDLELPPPCEGSNYVRLVGCCNGLICISMCATGSVFVLWNPATREFRNVPERQILVPNGKRMHAVFIGFGVVPKTGDYKIVRFLSYKVFNSNLPRVSVVDVYSKIGDKWNEVINHGLKCVVNEYSPTAVVSGAIHWLGTRVTKDKGKKCVDGKDVIVSFDLDREVFGDMLIPESDVYAQGYGWQISVVGDSLSLLAFPTCGNMSKSIDVWVMKEYGVAESWVKQSSIRLFSGVSRPVGCFKDGELILQNNKDKLFLYNPRMKKFGTLPLCNAKFVYDVHNYAESLVSVRAGI